jgi:GcrA cell cycle regulator
MTIQHRTVDIEASAKLWSEGLSASQIARRFGVSRNVVIGIAYRNRDGSHRARSGNRHRGASRHADRARKRRSSRRNRRSRPRPTTPSGFHMQSNSTN